MATLGQQIETTGRRHIDGLRATIRQLWSKAREHDGVEPESFVVVFSESNPYVPFLDKAQQEFVEARAAFVPGGGYVGLTIKKGKATC